MQAIEAILGRRTVPQVKMAGPGPDEAQLRRLLEAGAAAPDHGKLRPFRFIVVRGEARDRLGQLFADAAAAAEPPATAGEIEKQRSGPLRAPLILVVVARIDRRQLKVPEIEQVAAAAAAAQNILVAAHAMGLAGKWSTGRNAYDPAIKAGLGVEPADHIVGYLYLGSYGAAQESSPRPALEEVVSEWSAPVTA